MNSNPRTLKKLERLAETYEALIFSEIGTLALECFETETHFRDEPDDGHPWEPAEAGRRWGSAWGSAWFRGRVEVRSEDADRDLYIRSGLGGVETLFFVNGEPQGIFSKSLETGARGNHHTLRFPRAGDAPGTYDLAFEGYAGHPCVGTHPMDPREKPAGEPSFYRHSAGPVRVMRRNGEVKDFVFDLKTLLQLAAILPETSTRCGNIRRGLVELFERVPQCPGEMEASQWLPLLGEARELMRPLLACTNGSSAAFAGLTGQSHMDTAYLWTSKETIRKCARTFSNALSLMEQYPEYRFIQSSPIHAEMMLEHYPRLFDRIKEKVAEGRWEPNGGMYVESDGNMPSGESFIRQFLYGQAFTRTHFDYTADTFWLPDTFGYSAAFPQILKGCGIKYFLTISIRSCRRPTPAPWCGSWIRAGSAIRMCRTKNSSATARATAGAVPRLKRWR